MIRNVPEDARLEIKFVSNEKNVDVIENWLKLNPAGFYRPYPDRWVNNVYFDTHDYFAFNENLTGASCRTKLRYRWYGRSTSIGKGVLELKCKRNYFGWKIRFPVHDMPANDTSSWRDIRQMMMEQLDGDARNWITLNPHPVIINHYYRRYFVSRDDRIRATIDSRQAFFDQRYKPSPNFNSRSNIPRVLVLEFKFGRQDRTMASQILQGVPIRVSRNSKYVFGIGSITGL